MSFLLAKPAERWGGTIAHPFTMSDTTYFMYLSWICSLFTKLLYQKIGTLSVWLCLFWDTLEQLRNYMLVLLLNYWNRNVTWSSAGKKFVSVCGENTNTLWRRPECVGLLPFYGFITVCFYLHREVKWLGRGAVNKWVGGFAVEGHSWGKKPRQFL